MKRLWALVPFVIFIGMVILFVLPLLRGSDPSIVPSTMLGKTVPDFELPLLTGKGKLTQDDVQGSVTVLNFLASWCLPCEAEQPILKKMAQDRHIRLIGIDYKDREEWMTEWLASRGNPFYKIGFDKEGRAAIDFGVYGVPETFVIDREGIIRYKHIGPITEDDYRQIFQPLFAELQKK